MEDLNMIINMAVQCYRYLVKDVNNHTGRSKTEFSQQDGKMQQVAVKDRCTCTSKFEQKATVTEDRDTNAQRQKKHIMLSYNHGAQPIVKKIRDRLMKEGHNVWIDIDQIASGGSTLDAMSSAVENSSVILMFYSEAYKNSLNCRAEAEYAFEQRKHIIPVQVEPGYRATGWLGMIIGTKYRYNLSQGHIEQEIDNLVKNVKTFVADS